MGILFFLNYLYYSKHLHILLAFPNTYFSNLDNPGKSTNLKSVYNEIKLMIDPSYKIPETELKNGRVFKGEYYRDLPFVTLDFPRIFEKENVFAYRTMFWGVTFLASRFICKENIWSNTGQN